MAAKGAKETIANKLGFKSFGLKTADSELEKVRKENAQLKKSLNDLSKRNVTPPFPHSDSDKTKLLERIMSLESQREKNNQQLMVKEQEIATLRQQLRMDCGEIVASVQDQLEKKRQEAEHKDKQFRTLLQETEELKNQLLTVTQRCQALEKCSPCIQGSSGETEIQEQLRDVLEKNQQWLVYDQQREVYVQGILARMAELEQQLSQAKQSIQNSQEKSSLQVQSASPGGVEKQLELVRQELAGDKETIKQLKVEQVEGQEEVSRLKAELEKLRVRYEDRKQEFAQAHEELLNERRSGQLASEQITRLQKDLNVANARAEDERKRAAELLQQVNLLQKSLLKQSDEQNRITVLEEKIQIYAKNFENERLDQQSLQHQLQKVLKELRKARDQITHLESAKQQREHFPDPSSYSRPGLQDDVLTPTSPKSYSALDESFLECPNCRVSYPTTKHRELLLHLEHCFT
ncbi:centrosomal protein of 55 kDa [Hoplias malabaricus]|uniref:centrosomal protein of 55 kDa n=1 Tax=Hoplias malabaricus TaxID=27720 RepID=UPI003461BC52